ncbi:MAG: hypothetical protein QM790_17385 [Nibricoccus sp.]
MQFSAAPVLPPEASGDACPPGCGCSAEERGGCELFRLVAGVARARQESPGTLSNTLFGALPVPKTADVYGVRYAVFEAPEYGQLLVTRHGWGMLEALRPRNWYDGGAFWRKGEKMGQSTGTVYRYRPTVPGAKDVVIKVSRFAQDVPFYAGASFLEKIPEQVMAGLRFNNPFEEFGRLGRLRSSRRGPRILTKRPLAIYSPPEQSPLWQHGRGEGAAAMEQQAVAETQLAGHAKVMLDPHRSYFSIFGWINGADASLYHQAGQLSKAEMERLTEQSASDLLANGMIVLDHKPAHVIIRRRRDGRDWVRHQDGKIAYALVDFELLVDMPTVA